MSARASLLLLTGAGIAGAAGVALAALAAHKVQSPALASAAQLLLIHAAAVTALAALANKLEHARGFVGAALLLLAGSALFAGDIAMLSFAGSRLFPYAAPTGGSTMIAGWLVVAGVAIGQLMRQGQR
jgi:uncharacterized membrane protein YgdD (TMEM256/DUF423 family)